ncbi:hypothetical protein VTK26DRAFT_6592 [Humicola hyalothermophila]
MDTNQGFWSGRIARALLGLSNFIIFSSSVINTGILAWLVRRRNRGTHVIYQLVIAVITLFFYMFGMILPILKSYRGYMLPLNHILTYLWITSLIFSSQDWSGGRCIISCSLKHTVQAFTIIGFVFLLFNTIIEAMMWTRSRGHHLLGSGGDREKGQPLAATGGTTGATNGERTAQATV